MKILQCCEHYPPRVNGIAEVVSQLSKQLAAMGHDVHVATSMDARVRRRPKEQVTKHGFDVRGNAVEGIRGERMRYVAFVEKGAWDVVVVHGTQVWTWDLLLDRVGSFPFPTVFVPHGLSRRDVASWHTYYRNLASVLGDIAVVVALSAVGEEVRFCEEHGFDRVVVIPNGVDLREFDGLAKSASGMSNRIRRRDFVLNVSNHARQKGHENLFRLAREVAALGFHTIGVGNGIRAGRYGLGRVGVRGGCFYRCQARSALRRDIDFISLSSRKDLLALYGSACLFALVSNWEAAPLVLLEAMAAGLPWVATDVGNATQLRGGLVGKTIDEVIFNAGMLLEDREMSVALGREGRAEVETLYNWPRIGRLYNQLLVSLK